MAIKPARRIPKRFNRKVKRQTKSLVSRRYRRDAVFKRERLRRSLRRVAQLMRQWERSAVQWILIFLASALVVAVGILIFSPLMDVQEIRVRRVDPRLDIESVQRVLAPLFGKHLFFLTGGEVQRILQDTVEDLESVTVDKEYPSTLIVSVHLHPLVAQLRIVTPDEEAPDVATGTGTSLDYITAEGVYVSTPITPAVPLPTLSIVDWGVRPSPGDVLVSPAMLEHVQEAAGELQHQFGHEIQGQTVYIRAQEFHILAAGISFWFDMRSTVEEQIQRYRTFLQHISQTDATSYIDLRLKERVVYK